MNRIAAFLIALAPAVARAQGVALEMTLDTKSALVGQPVHATYRLTNYGKPYTDDLCLTHRCGLVGVEITTPAGATRQFLSMGMSLGIRAEREPRTKTLANSESVEATGCISYDERTQAFALPSPGAYTMRASYAGGDGDVFSGSVTVSVAAPTGDAAAALDFIVANNLSRYLCAEAVYYDVPKDAIAALDQLTRKYGNTPYAAGAEEALRTLGVRGALAPFPGQIDFGPTPIQTAVPYTLILKNNGMQPLSLTGFATIQAPFALDAPPDLPAALDAGAFLETTVTFTPPAAGSYAGALTIQTSSGEVAVRLAGEGSTAPKLRFSADQLDFGAVATGETATRTVRVSNAGLEALVVEGLSPLRAPFSYGPLPAFPHTLEPEQSFDVAVKFGSKSGTFRSAIVARSNDPWEPQARLDVLAGGGEGGGCGCRLGAAPAGGGVAGLGLLALLALALRRRRP